MTKKQQVTSKLPASKKDFSKAEISLLFFIVIFCTYFRVKITEERGSIYYWRSTATKKGKVNGTYKKDAQGNGHRR